MVHASSKKGSMNVFTMFSFLLDGTHIVPNWRDSQVPLLHVMTSSQLAVHYWTAEFHSVSFQPLIVEERAGNMKTLLVAPGGTEAHLYQRCMAIGYAIGHVDKQLSEAAAAWSKAASCPSKRRAASVGKAAQRPKPPPKSRHVPCEPVAVFCHVDLAEESSGDDSGTANLEQILEEEAAVVATVLGEAQSGSASSS